MEDTFTHNPAATPQQNSEEESNIEENNTATNYQDLINNLNNPEKIEEANKKEINVKETHKDFKKYYYRVSHDDYYAAKKILDNNVELKKNLRDEMKILDNLKDKPMLNNEERNEIKRIQKIIDEKDNLPDTEKIIFDKINKIEETLQELRTIIKNSP
jgi:hypothetical protein